MTEASATKRIAKNFSWLLIGNSLNGVLLFLSNIYLARILGAAAFGLLNFAQAFLIYLVLLVDSGLSILGTREIAREKQKTAEIAINILVLRLILAALLFLVSLIIILSLPLSAEMKWLFGGTFLFVFYRALNVDWVFQGIEQMGFISFGKLLFTLSVFGLIVWTVRDPLDLIKVPFINAFCGLLVSLLFLFVLFRKYFSNHGKRIVPGLWAGYFSKAMPLGASFIMIQVYANLDTIMLGFMDKPAVVGYYNAAYKVYYVLVGIFVLWHTTAMPTMSQRIKKDLGQAISFLNQFTRLTLLAFVPLCLAVFLWAPLIIRLVFGQQYSPASSVLQILIWIFIPVLIGSCYGIMWLVPAGRYKEYFWAAASGAVINIILNFILIPKYSMYGAAVATIVAELTAFLIAAYFAQRVARLNLFNFFLTPLALSAVSLLPSLILLENFSPFPPLIRSAIAGSVFLFIYLLLAFVVERAFIFKFAKELRSRGENYDR